jgi:hypothetical protein
MAKKKAQRADKPRIVKTWRIKQETIKEIARCAKLYKVSESEIIEDAIYSYHTIYIK